MALVDDDPRWSELRSQYDLVSMAARVAWEALVAAYKPTLDETGLPSAELLAQYRNASALRQAAEQALLAYLHERHGAPPIL